MKIYIENHPSHAGHWIYKGYEAAWKNEGFEVEFYDDLNNVQATGEYDIMADDAGAQSKKALETVLNARRAYFYVQPNTYPKHWGTHPNFVSQIREEYIDIINKADNTFLWTFAAAHESDFYFKWKKVSTVCLAYDSINYTPNEDSKYAFDLCYIGGWANNGFAEKKRIILEHFAKIKDLNLRVGFFINRGISLQEEANILYNSKIALNLHDEYQRVLGFDTNERIYKSLGLNGFCISDSNRFMENQFPEVPTAKDSSSYVELIKKYLESDLTSVKKQNRALILKEHTYISRVRQFMDL